MRKCPIFHEKRCGIAKFAKPFLFLPKETTFLNLFICDFIGLNFTIKVAICDFMTTLYFTTVQEPAGHLTT